MIDSYPPTKDKESIMIEEMEEVEVEELEECDHEWEIDCDDSPYWDDADHDI